MKNLIIFFFKSFAFLFGKRNTERLLIFGLKGLKIDIYSHALIQKGFTGWSDYDITGERKVLEIVKSSIRNNCNCFDVGANDGSYSLMLAEIFPNAQIHSFEPFPSTFEIAQLAIKGIQNINLANEAIGDQQGKLKLYNDLSSPNSQISTSYPDGLRDFYHSTSQSEIEVNMITLDQYCKKSEIQEIDFLKIDVEGAELSVLKGCKELIAEKRIKFIQFEFNNFNISSRTFLKDFYDHLPDFTFFRITEFDLIPLGSYTTENEIFRFQNILAVHCSVANSNEKFFKKN